MLLGDLYCILLCLLSLLSPSVISLSPLTALSSSSLFHLFFLACAYCPVFSLSFVRVCLSVFVCLCLSSGDEDYLFASQRSISLVKSDSFSASIGLFIQILSPFPFSGSRPPLPTPPQHTLVGGEPFPGARPNPLCELANTAYVLLCQSVRGEDCICVRRDDLSEVLLFLFPFTKYISIDCQCVYCKSNCARSPMLPVTSKNVAHYVAPLRL